jgi:peptidoglycan/xylan/chitin deacetylase (PgdA/CDA1 family)
MMLTRVTKESVKFAVYGCLGEVGRRLRAPAVPVITYHSLDELGSSMSLPPASFGRQMQYLRQEGFTALRLSDLVAGWDHSRPIPQKSFVLTFDDAFLSVYETAFPLLQELGFTATVFPVTSYVGGLCGWDIGPRNRQLGADRLRLMNWQQIREMSDHGFEVGSHGARHLRLGEEPIDVVRRDVAESQRELEDRLSRRCGTFCYPYGNFSDATRRVVAEAGFDAAVTLRFGWNDGGTDRYSLRRVGSARFTNLQVFKATLYGMYGWHLQRRNGHD